MKIENHRLILDNGRPCPFRASPNLGGLVLHRYLVMHFTSGRSAQSSIDWLCDPTAKASAHVVIGRDGAITQLVPFDRVAWHAGKSTWEGLVGLNQYSLGIELDNAGKLTRQNGVWRAWFGGEYPPEQVLEATHKNETDPAGWQVYPAAQLEAAATLSSLLIDYYNLLDVVGHEDISPHRKNDPGPAFPMVNFRSRVVGRHTTEEEVYETTGPLNIRSGPGTENPTLTAAPMPRGTRVLVLEHGPTWWRVDVENTLEGKMDLVGWVHHGWLQRAGSNPATLTTGMVGGSSVVGATRPAPAEEQALAAVATAATLASFQLLPAPDGYLPPKQSARALEGIPFHRAKPAPRAAHYLEKFAEADRGIYRNDPSRCRTLLQFPGGALFYDAKMAIDADGALDENGRPIATEIDPSGQNDTSLHYGNGKSFDAARVPFFVLPVSVRGGDSFIRDMGIKLGDLAMVIYKDVMAGAVFADQGPAARLGEGSIRLHELLPVHSPWRNAAHQQVFNASVDNSVLVFVFPDSALTGELTPKNAEATIQDRAKALFAGLRETA